MTPKIWEILDKIANYLIPVISVIASYLFGRLQSSNSNKYNAMKERYEKFYVPFIRFFYTNQLQSLKFSALSSEDQVKIYRLFLENIQYLDLDTMYSLDPLMYQFSLLILKRSGSELKQVAYAEDNLDGIFKETTESILIQAKELARKIHLPPIAEIVLEDILPEKSWREKLQEKQRLYVARIRRIFAKWRS